MRQQTRARDKETRAGDVAMRDAGATELGLQPGDALVELRKDERLGTRIAAAHLVQISNQNLREESIEGKRGKTE